MTNILLAIALCLSAGSVVTFDGDVITGNHLPKYATVCEDTLVYGDPGKHSVLSTLKAGRVVRLYEQSRNEQRDFAMIETAEWIPLSVLCIARR